MQGRRACCYGLLALAVLVGCGKKKPPAGPARYRAVLPDAPGYTLQGGALRYSAKAVDLELRVVDAAERLALLRHKAGIGVDPFSLTRDGQDFFFTVSLAIQNRGPTVTSFNPGFVVLQSGEFEHLYPRSLPELWSYLEEFAGEQGTEGLARVVFDSSAEIPPGGRVERLLVFNHPIAFFNLEKPPKVLRLEIGPLDTSGGDVLLRVPLLLMP